VGKGDEGLGDAGSGRRLSGIGVGLGVRSWAAGLGARKRVERVGDGGQAEWEWLVL